MPGAMPIGQLANERHDDRAECSGQTGGDEDRYRRSMPVVDSTLVLTSMIYDIVRNVGDARHQFGADRGIVPLSLKSRSNNIPPLAGKIHSRRMPWSSRLLLWRQGQTVPIFKPSWLVRAPARSVSAAMMAGRMSHSRFYDCAFSRGRSLAVHFDAASERLSNFSGTVWEDGSPTRRKTREGSPPVGGKTGGNAVTFLLIIV